VLDALIFENLKDPPSPRLRRGKPAFAEAFRLRCFARFRGQFFPVTAGYAQLRSVTPNYAFKK
jgi:hypothetical protein